MRAELAATITSERDERHGRGHFAVGGLPLADRVVEELDQHDIHSGGERPGGLVARRPRGVTGLDHA